MDITDSSVRPSIPNRGLRSAGSSSRSLYAASRPPAIRTKKTSFKRAAPNVDVLVFGQPNSGKDVFVEQYTTQSKAYYSETQQIDYHSKKVTLQGKRQTQAKLRFW